MKRQRRSWFGPGYAQLPRQRSVLVACSRCGWSQMLTVAPLSHTWARDAYWKACHHLTSGNRTISTQPPICRTCGTSEHCGWIENIYPLKPIEERAETGI